MDAFALGSALAQAIELSLLDGKRTLKSGSVAVSKSGAWYLAGAVGSENHLLDISSELAVLVRAAHNNDILIEEIHTLVTDSAALISPLTLKILADHSARTGIAIQYTIRDTTGKILFDIADARDAIPFYRAPDSVLGLVTKRAPKPAKVSLDKNSTESAEYQLRTWALAGCERNFPTYDGASGYGAALLTASGEIYYGGQYSTFEQRLGVHAEMGVLINALMDGVRDITHLGVASSSLRFVETPCSPCGCCRQFMAELFRSYDISPKILLFASGNEQFVSYAIENILPVQWSNKK
jgi:cytidine deaminase